MFFKKYYQKYKAQKQIKLEKKAIETNLEKLIGIIREIDESRVPHPNLENSDSFQFPDYRWRRSDPPKEEWPQYEIKGKLDKYDFVLTHMIRGSLIEFKLDDEKVFAYTDDFCQRVYAFGYGDVIYKDLNTIKELIQLFE